MKIAVDAMGGDYAPVEIVKGVIKAAHEYKGVEIILVGKQPLLHVLAGRQLKKLGIAVVHAEQNIEFHEHPMEALRQKPDASIPIGIGLLKAGKADAFISAGSTGAVFAAALTMLGKIEGVSRPAIASIINLSHSRLPALLRQSARQLRAELAESARAWNTSLARAALMLAVERRATQIRRAGL